MPDPGASQSCRSVCNMSLGKCQPDRGCVLTRNRALLKKNWKTVVAATILCVILHYSRMLGVIIRLAVIEASIIAS